MRGWISIQSFTEPHDNILGYQPWMLKRRDEWQDLSFTECKNHSGKIVVKVPGCETREQAKQYTNQEIYISTDQLEQLESDEYYWSDLIGLKVINKEGITLGVIDSILATGANDVIIVKGEHEHLIPYIKDSVLDIDLSNKQVTVDWDPDF